MRQYVKGTFWIGVYLLFILAPLFLLLIGPTPQGRGFWVEFSVSLGFVGLTIMGFQFLITARYRHLEAPFGMDIVYHFHRQVSWLAVALVLAHVVILFVYDAELLRLLNVLEAPWRARFGVAAVVALLLLVAASVWRLRLKLNYELWRLTHGILGTLVVASAMVHIVLVGHYTALPWKRALWIALTVFWVGLLVYIRIIKPLMMLRRPYRVTEVLPERGRATTLVLEPEGHPGFRFKPGQFAWLTLWTSPFAVQEHPFSFASSAEQGGRVAFTIKELGDFTETVKTVRPGQRAYLDGPYGAFSVDRHRSPGYVFIAGGSGIVPLMSTLRTLEGRGDQRPLLLFYGSKGWEDVTFREELEELERRLELRVVHVLTDPPEGWSGETGYVTAEVMKRYLPKDRNSRDYFICGPDPMMDAVEAELRELRVSPEHIHAERYNFV